MSTPSSEEPQPQDIALEQATPEQVEALEEQSESADEGQTDEADHSPI